MMYNDAVNEMYAKIQILVVFLAIGSFSISESLAEDPPSDEGQVAEETPEPATEEIESSDEISPEPEEPQNTQEEEPAAQEEELVTQEEEPLTQEKEPEAQEESTVEPWLPDAPSEEEEYESTYEELPIIDNKPYAKGDMELGVGLGGIGGSGFFSLSVGARFAYYVVPRLAPGIALNYQAMFGDLEYPQSFTTLPLLKFVLIRSRRFAPYILAAGGREFQWSGTDDPNQGYKAIDSWIVGGGVGMHIGIGSNFALMIQVMFLYYFFDESVIIAGESNPVDGHLYTPISIGMSFFF